VLDIEDTFEGTPDNDRKYLRHSAFENKSLITVVGVEGREVEVGAVLGSVDAVEDH